MALLHLFATMPASERGLEKRMLPPIPSWGGMHPFVAHFPIALLTVAPLLQILGLLIPRHRTPYFVAALILMVLGTLNACAAASTGEAASQATRDTQPVWHVLERHEELAEVSTALFGLLTVVFALMVIGPLWLRRAVRPALLIGTHALFLVIYAVGCLVLMHAGHEGGLLVHIYGIHAACAAHEVAPAGADPLEPARP